MDKRIAFFNVMALGILCAIFSLNNFSAFGQTPTPTPDTGRTGNSPRMIHGSYTLLNDGRVLAVGGSTIGKANDRGNAPSTSVEIYDPKTNLWSNGPSLPAARADANAIKTYNGTVFISGGYFFDASQTERTHDQNLRFNPSSNSWELADVASLATDLIVSERNSGVRVEHLTFSSLAQLVIGGSRSRLPVFVTPGTQRLGGYNGFNMNALPFSEKNLSDPQRMVSSIFLWNGNAAVMVNDEISIAQFGIDWIDMASRSWTPVVKLPAKGRILSVVNSKYLLVSTFDGATEQSYIIDPLDGSQPDIVLNSRAGATRIDRLDVLETKTGIYVFERELNFRNVRTKFWFIPRIPLGRPQSWTPGITSVVDCAPTLLNDGRILLGDDLLDESLSFPALPFFERDLPEVVAVNSANYAVEPFNGGTIIAAFGSNLPAKDAVVKVKTRGGTYFNCIVHFSSSGQINLTLPASAPTGALQGKHALIVYQPNGEIPIAKTLIEVTDKPHFKLYGHDGTGRELSYATALVLRVKPDGSQSYEPTYRFDQAAQRFIDIPIDFSNDADQLFLVLFGTGVPSSLLPQNVRVTIGRNPVEVVYFGPAGSIPGLSQINVRLKKEYGTRFSRETTSVYTYGVEATPMTVRYK